jgi:tRNA A37 threonylcarbamoyladenosine modification protein TsaB
MEKSSYGKIVTKYDNQGNLGVKLRLEPRTLNIRTGLSTAHTVDKQLILNYYVKYSNLKPMVAIYYDGGYQLIAIDLPMNQYYVDIFKQSNHNIKYLQKIYQIEKVQGR